MDGERHFATGRGISLGARVMASRRNPVDRANISTRRKLVIIGDGACGKTSLLSVFTLGYFPTVRIYPVCHTCMHAYIHISVYSSSFQYLN